MDSPAAIEPGAGAPLAEQVSESGPDMESATKPSAGATSAFGADAGYRDLTDCPSRRRETHNSERHDYSFRSTRAGLGRARFGL
jgi:hypothetical protein